MSRDTILFSTLVASVRWGSAKKLGDMDEITLWPVLWIERLQVFDGFALGFLPSPVIFGSGYRAGMTRQFLNGENVHPGV